MKKRILYGILNWGLGHATRSIPIIRFLLDQGHDIVIVSDGLALQLLKNEFPELKFEECMGYDVEYSKKASNFSLHIAKQIPKFLKTIQAEHEFCAQLCKKYDIDYIVSDNRYGFYHDTFPSAIICHQLRLLYPSNNLFENLVNKSYQYFLKKFDRIWVPDFPAPQSISGKLSQLAWKNIDFIGAASRLKPQSVSQEYNYLAILSGPEPQRTILEKKILTLFSNSDGENAIVRACSDKMEQEIPKNIKVFDMLNSLELEVLIAKSKYLVSRSGYTSIVDYIHLEKTCLLIPTPGQVEQEYLAEKLSKKTDFISCEQEKLELRELEKLKHCLSSEWPKTGYNYSLIQQFLLCSTS